MKTAGAAEEAVQLVGKYADRSEGLKEARVRLDRCVAHLRSVDAPSAFLLAVKREGREALNPRSRRRLAAAEAVRAALDEWKRESGTFE